MHKDFCERHPDKHISYSLYRAHVKNMNISFTALGNEECEICEGYRLHKKATSHDAFITLAADCTICSNWLIHHERYKKARELYSVHKKEPQNSSQVFFSADLEKVIMLPRLDTFKAAIFCQRLVCYNQTFAPLGKIDISSKPLAVIWHDGIAGRKQEDIMSAFYQFLIKNRDVSNINIWLDNCTAQNKNWLLYSMFVHLINSEVISTKTLTLYYFEPGHTFMSSDQVHHQVELAMKKKGKLYDFYDFEECVASINKSRVTVKPMAQENFLYFQNYISDRRIQSSNPRAYLKNMSVVCFTRTSYDLMYKNNFDDDYISLRFMNDKYLKNPNNFILEFRTEAKGVEPKRKADILEKLSSIIPPHKLVFWKNLPIKENEHSANIALPKSLTSSRNLEKNK